MGKIAGKIFFTSKKHHSNQSPAASSRCLQGHFKDLSLHFISSLNPHKNSKLIPNQPNFHFS
ncbi:hypothetical protein AX333_14845 [Salmonella enterica]|nr:hypothetical protein [Salmonella enterica]